MRNEWFVIYSLLMIDLNYYNGKKLEDAHCISLKNASFLYGINCFEGIRGYYLPGSRFLNVLDLDDHLNRLGNSLEFLNFNVNYNKVIIKNEILKIINDNKIEENIYIRLTYFLEGEGSWRETENIGFTINIRSIYSDLLNPDAIQLGISKFLRISKDSLPPFVKAGSNYLNSRYALLETQRRGFEGALFLNNNGFISEATGSCIFFIKNGAIYTPSDDSDILLGITRNTILKLAIASKIVVNCVLVPLEEVDSFECAFLAGTMAELKPISRINDHILDINHPVFMKLLKLYREYIYGMEV